jgi:hypothetical protein
MLTHKNHIRKLIQNIITSGSYEKSPIEVRHKTIMINIICIIGILNLIPLGIAACIHDESTVGCFDLTLKYDLCPPSLLCSAILFYLSI